MLTSVSPPASALAALDSRSATASRPARPAARLRTLARLATLARSPWPRPHNMAGSWQNLRRDVGAFLPRGLTGGTPALDSSAKPRLRRSCGREPMGERRARRLSRGRAVTELPRVLKGTAGRGRGTHVEVDRAPSTGGLREAGTRDRAVGGEAIHAGMSLVTPFPLDPIAAAVGRFVTRRVMTRSAGFRRYWNSRSCTCRRSPRR